MKIEYADLVLLNAELKKKNTRYHVSYKNEYTACIEPPGECCMTDELKQNALNCIKEYYKKQNITVRFSKDQTYFICEGALTSPHYPNANNPF